jgi:hypothetical protein
MLPTPVLTVVIIAHHTPHLIAQAVAAFASEKMWGCECIVVNDGMGENIALQCLAASRGSAHIRQLRHKVPEGMNACRNAALRMARGECIVFADDIAALDWPVLRASAVDLMATSNQVGVNRMFHAATVRQAGGWNETLGEQADADLLVRLQNGGERPSADPVDILFIPHKDYHVWTISLLRASMEEQGLTFGIVDITAQWRDDGVRAITALNKLPLVKLGALALGRIAPRVMVVFNDWDPITRPIILSAQTAGMATAGIVEGIQDYADADVPWSRQAYQAVDTVLLPGAFDKAYFQCRREGQSTAVVGVARIEALRAQPIDPSRRPTGKGRVLINSNFAYDVLVDDRDRWLTEAVGAVLMAGLDPVISRHPADRGVLFPEYETDLDFYSCLETCQATIQRFASGVLESLAREVPVLYFRPRGEMVEKFITDPMGVYPVCKTVEQLQQAMGQLRQWQKAVTDGADAFLDHHAGHKDGDVAKATVTALSAARRAVPDHTQLIAFQDMMRGVDRITHALTKPGAREKALFGTLEQTEEIIAKCRNVANLSPSDSTGSKTSVPLVRHKLKRVLSRIVVRFPRWLFGR